MDDVMDLTTWLSLVVICFLGAISPGPSLAVILRLTLSQSPLHGAVAAVAHGFGISLWALFTMQGLALLVTQYPNVFYVMSLTGGVYLAWLGIQSIRFAGRHSDAEVQGTTVSYWEAARDGALIALMNPKAALFFLALFSQFIRPDMEIMLTLSLWTTVFLIDTLWYVLVAMLLAGGPVLRYLRGNQIWVDRGMGVLLVILGLSIFLR